LTSSALGDSLVTGDTDLLCCYDIWHTGEILAQYTLFRVGKWQSTSALLTGDMTLKPRD
jgi:hypothetical protein